MELDRNKSYGEIVGTFDDVPGARFEQDGLFFSAEGKCLSEPTQARGRKPRERKPEAAPPQNEGVPPESTPPESESDNRVEDRTDESDGTANQAQGTPEG